MWKEILLNYGVFLLELLTLFGIIALIISSIIEAKKQPESGSIVLTNLSQKYQAQEKSLRQFFLSKIEQKQLEKSAKKAEKAQARAEKRRLKNEKDNPSNEKKARLFILDFVGDIQANGVSALRKEIDAVISLADPSKDEVLLKLESPGGVVHGYGLAASQLQRIKDHQIPLTVAVDKIAASGGYMMACVANNIVSAPFAILGSIGVVAQVPNIHRLLKKHEIDVDVMTAGEYKRTVTFVGENTEAGKQKFQQQLEQTHQLFKQFVSLHRPQVNLAEIATGEHWFGQQALDLKLVDRLATSDELILQAVGEKDVIKITYRQKKNLAQRVGMQLEHSLQNAFERMLNKIQFPFI